MGLPTRDVDRDHGAPMLYCRQRPAIFSVRRAAGHQPKRQAYQSQGRCGQLQLQREVGQSLTRLQEVCIGPRHPWKRERRGLTYSVSVTIPLAIDTKASRPNDAGSKSSRIVADHQRLPEAT